MLYQQSRVPDCSECDAYAENVSTQFVEEEVCPNCPHSNIVEHPIIYKLFHYINLLAAGCPVGRHELSDMEWGLLGQVRSEWQRLAMDEIKEKNKVVSQEINYNGESKWRGKGRIFRRR